MSEIAGESGDGFFELVRFFLWERGGWRLSSVKIISNFRDVIPLYYKAI